MESNPPNWAKRLVEWLTDGTPHTDILGDLNEEYAENIAEKGIGYANRKYSKAALLFLRPFLLKYKFNIKLLRGPSMLRNYWIVSQRVLIRNKLYAGINILGLALGLACSFVLLIFVSNELSFDKFHANQDQIHRLLVKVVDPDGESVDATSIAAIAPALKDELPEVKEFVRFASPISGFISLKERKVNVSKVLYADSSLFEVFSFNLIQGNSKTCLVEPYSILLTPSLAVSLFNDVDPVGQTVLFNGEKPLKVTGIVEAPPSNSQIQFSSLISFSSLEKDKMFLGWNGGWNYLSYILIEPRADIKILESKFPALMYRNINKQMEQIGVEMVLETQPLIDVHLGREVFGDWSNKGNLQYIFIFGAVALITLMMGSINFVNLTASQGITRLKEIAVRKAIGARKWQLVKQFLFESFVYTFLSAVLAIIFIALSSNMLQEFLGYSIGQIYLSNLRLGVLFILIILIVSVLSGAYPAFYLTSLSSLANEQSLQFTTSGKHRRTNVLTIFQFLISIVLISATWYIYGQLKFIQERNPGYQQENQLVVRLSSEQSVKNLKNFKIELAQIPEIIGVGASSETPGDGFTSNGYVPDGKQIPVMIHVLDIDETFLDALNIEVIEGRGFSEELKSDDIAYLVNETLVREMGWDEPIGKHIRRNGDHEVIGVIRDFNYASLHQQIEPLILTNQPWRGQFKYLTINFKSGKLPETIEKIEDTWNTINSEDPFEFFFLDEGFGEIYYREQTQAKLLFTFTVLAILIGAMGLFGQVSFSLKQKTKEIGVRKVLGATSSNLLIGISRGYIISILIASIIAIPIVFSLMSKWLDNFFYRIDLSPIVFIISVLIALIIALFTINIQTLSAIRKNPTESLKYE